MNDLDNLRAELEKTPRRGGWSDYLRKNSFAFKTTIVDLKPVDWAVIAAWAQRNGHTGKGDPAPAISASACRKAFERERVARGDGRQPKPVAVTATKPKSDLSSVVRMLPQPEPPVAISADAPHPDVNKLRRGRPWLEDQSVQEPTKSDDDAKSALERLSAEMDYASRFMKPAG